ncbi:MRG/MORF4L-binding protein [Lampetra fluviatilis]
MAGEAAAVAGAAAGESVEEAAVVWSPEVEVCLFHAMLGHKPVGINRHFHMVCIRDKFSQNIGRQVPSRVIWDHLAAMYDIPALVRAQNDSESLPFPNVERPFCLPDDILHDGRDIKEGKVVEIQEDAPERESSQGPAEDKSGSRDPTDKRKRSRAPASTSSSSPASPGGAAPVSKRRRT